MFFSPSGCFYNGLLKVLNTAKKSLLLVSFTLSLNFFLPNLKLKENNRAKIEGGKGCVFLASQT